MALVLVKPRGTLGTYLLQSFWHTSTEYWRGKVSLRLAFRSEFSIELFRKFGGFFELFVTFRGKYVEFEL